MRRLCSVQQLRNFLSKTFEGKTYPVIHTVVSLHAYYTLHVFLSNMAIYFVGIGYNFDNNYVVFVDISEKEVCLHRKSRLINVNKRTHELTKNTQIRALRLFKYHTEYNLISKP